MDATVSARVAAPTFRRDRRLETIAALLFSKAVLAFA
jgi:hypothetical protein